MQLRKKTPPTKTKTTTIKKTHTSVWIYDSHSKTWAGESLGNVSPLSCNQMNRFIKKKNNSFFLEIICHRKMIVKYLSSLLLCKYINKIVLKIKTASIKATWIFRMVFASIQNNVWLRKTPKMDLGLDWANLFH